jgi:oligopeptide/dipeptide ABC transporter ATP-binding protein
MSTAVELAAGDAAGDTSLLAVEDVAVEYRQRGLHNIVRAIDGVSLTIQRHETVGVVGESGSGKSTLGRAILGLVPLAAGSIRLGGAPLTVANRRQRVGQIQAVFQDPYSCLNPARTIGDSLVEPVRALPGYNRAEASHRATDLLRRVGIGSDAMIAYPSRFSGGQRQRIAIARAVIASPRLVICDEAVSALDLSVQAQVLNLLHELQAEFGLSMLFITHDLAVVRYLADRLYVLYGGRVMESGPTSVLTTQPHHPYTRMLIDAAPVADPRVQRGRRRAAATAPAASQRSSNRNGCPFAPRCGFATQTCHEKNPKLELTPVGTFVACHRWREISDERTTTSQDDTDPAKESYAARRG